MSMRCCACSLTPILAVAGLLGLGAAGYRVAAGGCPMCHGGTTATKLVAGSNSAAAGECPVAHMNHEQLGHTKVVSADEKSACCAGMAEAECQAKMAECPAHGGCCDQQKKADAPEKVASTGK